jgi:hypothetical protein
MTSELTWYIARSAGLVAWLAAAIAVTTGLLASTGLWGPRPHRAWLIDLHRLLSGLTVSFTAIHLVALAADGYVEFGVRELFVPLASSWRSGATAWGVVALYLLVAVELTARMPRLLGERLWRSLHWLSVVLLVTSTAHAYTAGSDVTDLMALSPAVGVLTFAGGLLWWRVRHGRRGPTRSRSGFSASVAPTNR